MHCRGTAFTPGSSGSAWVANYGIDADIGTDAEGVPLGQYGYYNAERNVVLGVTSWGDTVRTGPEAPAYSGCSMFATNREFPASTYGIRGPGNIGALMDAGECWWHHIGLLRLRLCRHQSLEWDGVAQMKDSATAVTGVTCLNVCSCGTSVFCTAWLHP